MIITKPKNLSQDVRHREADRGCDPGNPLQVTNMPVAHLAAWAGVSEGSVINFADRVGVWGFSVEYLGAVNSVFL